MVGWIDILCTRNCGVKLSLLLLYKSMFVRRKKLHIAVYGPGGFVIVYGTIFFFLSVFMRILVFSLWNGDESDSSLDLWATLLVARLSTSEPIL